jgi:hypothetical protein
MKQKNRQGPMRVQTSDYIDVERRAAELGLNVPTGFAILSRHFETAESKGKLMHEDTTPTVRALLQQEGIVETPIEKEGERIPYIEENAFEWVGPTIFIGASIFSGNANVVSIALGVIADYLTDYFKGRTGAKRVRLQIVVPQQRTAKHTKITYEGDIEGIKEIPNIIKEVRDGRAAK